MKTRSNNSTYDEPTYDGFSSSSIFSPGAWFLMNFTGDREKFYVAEILGEEILLCKKGWPSDGGMWVTRSEMERPSYRTLYIGHGRPKKLWKWIPFRSLHAPFYEPRPCIERKIVSVTRDIDTETLPPLSIWLQWCERSKLGKNGPVKPEDIAWNTEKVFPNDIEYVQAGKIRRALKGSHYSSLWGDSGLIAATMRCVETCSELENLVTTDGESKENLIDRIRSVLHKKD